MKKLLGLTVAAFMVIALVGGGTWAYFGDTETSTGNTFTAGTLNLIVNADPLTQTFSINNIKPGDQTGDGVHTATDWVLKNNGSIDGSLDITFSGIVDNENGINVPEAADPDEDGTDDGELAERLSLTIYIDEDNDDTYDNPGDTLIYQGYVKGVTNLTGEKLSNYAMAANYGSAGDKAFRIEWSVDASVGNEIQSDSTGFNIEFELLQVAG